MVQQLTLFDAMQDLICPGAGRILSLLRSRRRITCTRALSALTGWAERTIRAWLHLLERLGLVARPRGPRRGWMAV